MTIHALVQVPTGVANIPCITQVTFKLIHNALLANNSGLSFSHLEILVIQILADKAFSDDWFNKTYKLNLTRADLVDLLRTATHNQLFQLNGVLYEQTDGVATGSPLGPLLANVFMCSIEAKLQQDGKLPSFYRRYVDDTLTIMPDRESADCFLRNLNDCHPSIKFTTLRSPLSVYA